MPMLSIRTNAPIAGDARAALLSRSSQILSETSAKPERYVMVALESEVPMMFDGNTAPTAFLDVRSLGLDETQAKSLARALSLAMADVGIDQDRVFLNFSDWPRPMRGWNGGTF